MQLPEQLRKQIEQANQHFQSLENPAQQQPAEADPAALPEPEKVPEPAKQDGEQQPATEPVVPPKQDEDVAYWRHRFQTLQGKYNAEVPALTAKVRELEAELAKAKEAPAAAAPNARDALETINQLSDEQLSEFGPDMLAMVETLIQRRIGQAQQPDPELVQKLERLEQAEQQRHEESRQDAEARFWAALHAGIPRLEAINADPAFHAWLAKFDPLSGLQRQQALVQAQQALSAERVIAIFNAYHQETGAAPAPKREVPAEAIQPKQTRSTEAPAAGKIWTGAEISAFYQDKARGKYSREEAERIEADIFAATASGRVR